MTEEEGVAPNVQEGVETSTSPVEQQPETNDVKEVSEPVDEMGVPIKNRLAEYERKLAKLEAQNKIVPDVEENEDEAIKIVESIAEKKVLERLSPVIARQFLSDYPDAANMIDDINRIRQSNPEISGVDKLSLAYKIALAEKQDEIIRQRVEQESQARAKTIEESKQASIEGTGRSTSPAPNINELIANAKTMDDLLAVEQSLRK